MSKIKIFVFLLCIFTFYSCDKSNFKWEVYSSSETKLLSKNERIKDIQINGENIYLIGSYGSSRNLPKSKAIVYRANINELKFDLIASDRGEFYTSSFTKENSFYLMRRIFTENSFANTKSYLCSLNLKNERIKTLKEIKGFVKYIHFQNKSDGCLLVNKSNKRNENILLVSKNSMKVWDTIPVDKVVYRALYKEGQIFFLENYYSTEFKKRINGKLCKLNLELGKIEVKDLNKNTIDFDISSNDILLLCKNKNIITLEMYKSNERIKVYDFGKKENLFPKMLYRYGDFVSVVIGELNKIGTSNHLYLSFDGGETFTEERMPIDSYANPISFYKDEKIIIYSGSGRISVCDLKN